jgi:hypothetical protein
MWSKEQTIAYKERESMGVVVSTLTPPKSLQLKLIVAFSMLRCSRAMQLEIIRQVIGVRKNITDLTEDETRRVLQEVLGEGVIS